MKKEYCDICGADVIGSNFDDFFGGREYRVVKRRTCEQRLTYFMRNKAELEGIVTTMSLKNRIRYLFLRPLKTEKGGHGNA